MGKIERLVVIGVGCVIVVILAVTFTPSEAERGANKDVELAKRGDSYSRLGEETGTQPVRLDENRLEAEDLASDPVQPAVDRSSKTGDSAFLSTGVTPKRGSKVAIPEGSILIAMEGLEDSYLPEFKIYEPTQGDSFGGLALRFYGEEELAWLIKSYNEGQETVVVGKAMFIPVFRGAEDVELEEEPAAAGSELYEVQEGESLWTIAKDFYGSGATWKKIHEANLDVIPDAHDLKAGVRLRIPR